MVLAVNKYDLIGKQEGDGEEVEEMKTEGYLKEFAETHGFCGMYRTSAKTGKNVTATFSQLVYEILKHKAEFDEEATTRDTKIRGASLYAQRDKPKKKSWSW